MPLFDGIQSALNPQGPHAAEAAEIAWVLFIGAAAIFVVVLCFTAWAIYGTRRRWLASRGLIIGGGIVFPAIALFALLLYTLTTAGRLAAAPEPDVRIAVTGHQWWWEVEYLTPEGKVDFVTANELRIPVGRNVEVALSSADVLHSFWVPALAGKLDLVPGKDNRLRLAASRAGVTRGQCAEYCGGPHAQMAFYVVAQEEADFEAWRQAQRQPADSTNELFVARCGNCHTVRGTQARGTLGPDLTHVGSRLSIAAGILPNNAGTIAGWIASSQHIKPGNLMPAFEEFSGEELRTLAAYVENLK